MSGFSGSASAWKRRHLLQAGAGALALGAAGGASAQAWPARSIRVIVPYAPGGSTDLMGRLTAQEVTKILGVPVVVENRSGANGFLGANAAAAAAPDGYTFIVLVPQLAVVVPLVRPDLPLSTGLVPVVLIQTNEQVLVARNALPANTLREVVDYIKQRPKQFSYAHTGLGTANQIFSVLLQEWSAEINILSYRGEVPALTDVVAGHLDMTMSSLAAALPLIREGKVKAIATTGDTRARLLPQVPTVTEAGFGEFNGNSALGYHAPRGTPEDIVERFAQAVAQTLALPEIRQRIEMLGGDPGDGRRDSYITFLARRRERMAVLVREGKVRLED